MKTKRVFSVVGFMLALLIVGMIWMGGGRETLNVDRPLYKECSSKSLEIIRLHHPLCPILCATAFSYICIKKENCFGLVSGMTV